MKVLDERDRYVKVAQEKLARKAREGRKRVLERIGQYELEKREDVKALMDFVGKTLEYLLRKDWIFRSFMNIRRKNSEVYWKSLFLMFVALFLSLPDEKFKKVTEGIARLEEDELVEVERKIKALKKEI